MPHSSIWCNKHRVLTWRHTHNCMSRLTIIFLLLQVLNLLLFVQQPAITCGRFVYKERDDLDDAEQAANDAILGKTLQCLPGMCRLLASGFCLQHRFYVSEHLTMCMHASVQCGVTS